jgi:hypothetical protein
MKTKFIILLTISLLIICAIATNPSPERHKEAFKNKIYQYLHEPLSETLSNTKTIQDESIFTLEMLVGNTIYETLVDNLVSSENYILFSLTQISIAGESKIIGYGFLGNVMPH